MGIHRQQALDCLRSDDLIGLGMEADAIRRRLHPENAVTYVLDHTLVYSDHSEAGLDVACTEARAAAGQGATGIAIHSSGVSLDACELLLTRLKRQLPALWLEGPTATELIALTDHSFREALRGTLLSLRDAGLDSLPGHDCPSQASPGFAGWLAVHRLAHSVGIPTSAAMTFGAGESFSERVTHLEALRQLQQETGGFTAFLPIAARPLPGAHDLDGPTSVECLKTLAVARMVLDDIPHIDASAATPSLKVLQMALRFGADDAGPASLASAPAARRPTSRPAEEDLRRIIRDAGFQPVQRDIPYRTNFLN